MKDKVRILCGRWKDCTVERTGETERHLSRVRLSPYSHTWVPTGWLEVVQ